MPEVLHTPEIANLYVFNGTVDTLQSDLGKIASKCPKRKITSSINPTISADELTEMLAQLDRSTQKHSNWLELRNRVFEIVYGSYGQSAPAELKAFSGSIAFPHVETQLQGIDGYIDNKVNFGLTGLSDYEISELKLLGVRIDFSDPHYSLSSTVRSAFNAAHRQSRFESPGLARARLEKGLLTYQRIKDSLTAQTDLITLTQVSFRSIVQDQLSV